MSISVNALIRDEPFAFYGLASVAPYVDEMIVVDTGSEQKYLNAMDVAISQWKHLKFFREPLDSAHAWKIRNNEVIDDNKEIGAKLGDLRRWMHTESTGDTIVILDGDEIYNDSFAKYILKDFIKGSSGFYSPFFHDIYCTHLPFFDFIDKTTIRLKHRMGRLFKRENVEIKGDYPFEMHHVRGGSCITDNHHNNYNVPYYRGFVYHMEAVVKPHRKEIVDRIPFSGQFPEVFEQYKDGKFKVCKDLITPYGF